jgi:FkbM family methyltransferase
MTNGIEIIHHHAVKTDLLKEGGWVLDLGCSGFDFPQAMIDRGMKVIGLDPDKDAEVPIFMDQEKIHFLRKACVGVPREEMAVFYQYEHGGANSIYNTPRNLNRPDAHGGHANNPFKCAYGVDTTTISDIKMEFGIDQFEIIKMDVEGAEYEILANFPRECTKQLTLEFHDFLSLNPWGNDIDKWHEWVNTECMGDYEIVYQEAVPLKRDKVGNLQRNDVLYVLKDLL